MIPLLLLLACPETPPDPLDGESDSFEYPLDDVLDFAHLQALGTHNSYHLRTGRTLKQWDYEHLPLDQQAEFQGVRQFEWDLYRADSDGPFEVLHVPLFDAETTCFLLEDCLEDLKRFSDANPGHHPLLVLLEPKFPANVADTAESVGDLEEALLAVWPEDRLVTPSLVAGDSDSLASAVESTGWPTLGELRGRAMFVLHTGGPLRDALTAENPRVDGHVLFPDAMGAWEEPHAAVHTMNDPIGGFDAIQAVVLRGHLVRTRADSDLVEPSEGDTTRQEAALDSGAHFISTDVPEARADLDYVAKIPGGTPSRCNPMMAPEECTPEAIEDPAFIGEARR